MTTGSVPAAGAPAAGVPGAPGGGAGAPPAGTVTGDGAAGAGPTADLAAAARSGVLNLVGAGFSAGLGMLLTVAVTRLFPVEVAGTFFVAMSIFLIAMTVSQVGTGVGTVYLLSGRRARGEPARLRAVFQVAARPALVVGVVVAAVAWLAAPWLARQMGADDPAGATAAVRAAAVFVPAAALFMLYASAMRGLGRSRPFVVLERMARPGLQLVGIVAVGGAAVVGVGAAAGAELVTAVWAGCYLPLTVVAVGWARRMRRRLEHAGGVVRPARPDRADWWEFWRFTGPRSVTGVATVGLQRLDVILVAALLGPAPVALYVAASRFLVVGQLANQSLGHAVQHQFATLFAAGRHDAARQLYRTTTGWLIVTVWPLFLLCVVLAEPVLALFGPGYPAAAQVMRLLSSAMLLSVACGMVTMALEMAGRTVATLTHTLLALATNVVLNLLLIPRLGLVGAAAAWAAAIAVKNLLPAVALYRSHRMQPIGRSALVAMAAAGGCLGLLPGAALVSGGGLPVVGAAAGVGAGLYLAVLWWARRVLRLDLLASLRRHRSKAPDSAG